MNDSGGYSKVHCENDAVLYDHYCNNQLKNQKGKKPHPGLERSWEMGKVEAFVGGERNDEEAVDWCRSVFERNDEQIEKFVVIRGF